VPVNPGLLSYAKMVTSVGLLSPDRMGIELVLLLRVRKPKPEEAIKGSSASVVLAGVRGGGLDDEDTEDMVLVRLRLDTVWSVEGLPCRLHRLGRRCYAILTLSS
jgi:hypothetical protein